MDRVILFHPFGVQSGKNGIFSTIMTSLRDLNICASIAVRLTSVKMINEPPRHFLRFLRWFCHPELKTYIEGDLMELYQEGE